MSTHTITVDIDLDEQGLHTPEDCPADDSPLRVAYIGLHRQAHPDEPSSPDRCMRQPCLDLSYVYDWGTDK
ncbi:hypothetical protein [Embleya sp. NPDC059237]|uniref:hypothetical protein n=1 Tax=Embleya sp. NPDC059237 TaxID=3346784 RepID=UPI0036A9A274